MPKPIVHYREHPYTWISKGFRASILPIDHPSDLVSNIRVAITSEVIRVGENGEFETLNTVYQPVRETK